MSPAVAAPTRQYGGWPADSPDPYAGLDHTGTPPLPPRDDALPPSSGEPGKRREVPNYDGRPGQDPSAGEGLIWVPRVLFYPLHLVLEYGLRWPIVQGITFAEKHYLIERTKRLFTFADGKSGLFPTLFFDFGVNPSAGLYFYYNDLGFRTNSLSLQAGVWADDWYHVIATDSFKVFRNDSGEITLRGEFIYRPDQVFKVFSGINRRFATDPGTNVPVLLPRAITDEHFFRVREVELESSLRAKLTDLNRVSFGVFYRNVKIENGYGPSIEDSAVGWGSGSGDPASAWVARRVPGYNATYNLIESKLRFELDSRSPDRVFTPGSGLRLELFGSFAIDPGQTALNFVRWGAEAGGFWDVSGINHVLGLHLYLEALEATGDAPVPLTERIALGGGEHMRGFLEGWFRGDSAFELTLDYRYPIWSFLDAYLFASLGNVFEGRFEYFHVKRMQLNWGIGFRSNTSREVSFDFMVGFGTNELKEWDEEEPEKGEPRNRGFEVDNVRVIFGINQGF